MTPMTKAQFAYEQLRTMVLAGDLEPGAAVNQDRLALRLGISVSPVREAVRRLQAENLIVGQMHNTLQVAPLEADEAALLVEIRSRLDPLAVRMAAIERTDADLAAIDQALHQLKPMIAGAGRDAIAAHRQFHRSLYVASHSPIMVELLERLWDKADRYRYFALRSSAAGASRLKDHEQHVLLAEAVRDSDPDHAEALMAAHIEQSLGAAWSEIAPTS